MNSARALRRIGSVIGRLFYPVSRKLSVCVLAYMTGIVVAQKWSLSPIAAGILCAFLLAIAARRRRFRRSLLPLVCAGLMAVGNCAAGMALAPMDEPTAPRTAMSGTVLRVEKDDRVLLGDVVFSDGTALKRPVLVSLMRDDETESPASPMPGQRVSGVGRLFAQDGVRNPGGVDQRLRALCDGYDLSGYILPGWSVSGEETFSIAEVFRRLRLRLSDTLEQVFGEDAAFFSAILIGEKGNIDPAFSSAMRLTGTAHMLSVSGMHLSMVSAGIYTLLRRLPISRKHAYAIQAIAMLLYAGLTGFAVGAVRALVMSLLGIWARLRARRYDPLTSLATAALVITAFSPLMVFDAGFQYSFFVVLGIQLLRRPIGQLPPMQWLCKRARWLGETVTISLSAQLASLPIQLSLYGYIPLTALPMNLAGCMMMPLMMLGGWILLGLGFFLPSSAEMLAGIVCLPLHGFERMTVWAASIPGGILRLPAPGLVMIVIFGMAMALISPQIRFGPLRRVVLAVVAAVMMASYLPRLDPSARYVQIDVGQGDASLIRSGRHAVVIDVGPAYSYELLRYLRHEGLYIDALILTHMDEDHAGALRVIAQSEVGTARVIVAERAEETINSQAVQEGLALLEEKGIPLEMVKAGDTIHAMGLRFDVLSPTDELSGSNERSLLLSVDAADTRLLLAGDLPKDCEPENIPNCDLLKVAHHGSANASSTRFLEASSPQIAIISVGAGNWYGHPHQRVLQDLSEIEAQIYRTDLAGCVTVWLGDSLRTQTFLNDAAQ